MNDFGNVFVALINGLPGLILRIVIGAVLIGAVVGATIAYVVTRVLS